MKAAGALAMLAVAALAAPAGAELEWLPEAEFYARYSFPVQGARPSGPDPNFEIVSGQLGTRLRVAPGLSLRAVGELLTDPSRRSGDLRVGYGEYVWEPVGVLRGGQIPMFGEVDDAITGDPILGRGVLARAGFFSLGGLGASWEREFPTDLATATVEVAGTYTEGLLGSVGLPENKLFVGIQGPGPAGHARASVDLAENLAAHVLFRYGLVQDQQIAGALAGRLFDLDLQFTGGASISSPPNLPVAADGAAMVRVRYNLGNLSPGLWRTDLVARGSAISRNFTNTPTFDAAYPEATPRTDLLSTLAIVYRITDFSAVTVDLTEGRALAPAVSSALFLGVRGGVKF